LKLFSYIFVLWEFSGVARITQRGAEPSVGRFLQFLNKDNAFLWCIFPPK